MSVSHNNDAPTVEITKYGSRYHNSLVGGDFKLWSQFGLFIVWPYMTDLEQKVWLSLAKVPVCHYYTFKS